MVIMTRVSDISTITDAAQSFAKAYKKSHNRKLGTLEKQLLVSTIVLGLLFVVFSTLFFVTQYYYTKLVKDQVCNSRECIESAMTLLQTVDFTQDPCQDFYKFACGRFPVDHPIKENGLQNSWFSEKDNQINRMLSDILKSPISPSDLPIVSQTKEFYQSCLNKTELNMIGLAPLYELLEKLDLPIFVPNRQSAGNFSLARTLALAQRYLSQDILVSLSISKDPGNGSTLIAGENFNVFKLSPGVTTMGVFDVWNSQNAMFDRTKITGLRGSIMNGEKQKQTTERKQSVSKLIKKITVKFISMVLQKIMEDSGEGEVEVSPDLISNEYEVTANRILEFISLVMTDLDIDEESTGKNVTERLTLPEFESIMNDDGANFSTNNKLDWKEYFSVLTESLNRTYDVYSEPLLVENLQYFKSLNQILRNVSAETLQRHVWWKVVEEYAKFTTTDIRAIYVRYYATLFGEGAVQSRNSICTYLMKNSMSVALAYEMSMHENFTKASKKVLEMLRDIRTSFESMVKETSWMDEPTKSVTLDKANAIKNEIGYANWMTDSEKITNFYQGLELKESEFLMNLIRVSEWEVQKILETLGPIKDNSTKTYGWFINPLQVNAYYSHMDNTVYIPAGILRTPFYFRGLESLNYGAIGTILGHELTHGFDIDGRNYNKYGEQQDNLWSAKMVTEYETRAKCFVGQYENYTVYANNRVNGTFTLAENIADNGGIRESYRAYKLYTNRHGQEPKLPGFENYTHEQLLFLSYANIWCEAVTPKFYMLTQDLHSPQRIRVLVTLQNMKEFSEAYRCPENSFMNPPEKCIIW